MKIIHWLAEFEWLDVFVSVTRKVVKTPLYRHSEHAIKYSNVPETAHNHQAIAQVNEEKDYLLLKIQG